MKVRVGARCIDKFPICMGEIIPSAFHVNVFMKVFVAWGHADPMHHFFIPRQTCQSLTCFSLSLISKRQCPWELVPFPSIMIYL